MQKGRRGEKGGEKVEMSEESNPRRNVEEQEGNRKEI